MRNRSPSIAAATPKNDYRLGVRLLAAIGLGAAAGMVAQATRHGPVFEQIVGSVQHFCGQVVFFVVPLVVLAFIGPAVIKLGAAASRMLAAALSLSYASSIGAALFAYATGILVFPRIQTAGITLDRQAADIVFRIDIPPLFGVMTALAAAIILGLAVLWSGAKRLENLWTEFEDCIRGLIPRIVVPLLPILIAATFARLAYLGIIGKQLPLFGTVIALAIAGHCVWIAVLYSLAGVVSRRNPWEVIRHYGPAYITAIGTMSSTATLPVSLNCARKSRVLSRETVDFMIPLCATTHLCGSVLTEVLFIMVISHVLYGGIPAAGPMLLFITLLGVFAVGAPSVPSGTMMGTLGLVSSLLGFDANGVALLLAVYTIQDSFGTACNVVSDGALALMMEGLFRRHKAGARPPADPATSTARPDQEESPPTRPPGRRPPRRSQPAPILRRSSP